MKAGTLTALGIGAVLTAGAWTLVQAQQPPTSRATLTLAMSGNTCGKTLTGNDTDPNFRDRIRARRNGAVEWTVVNNCRAEAVVRLDEWIRKNDNGAESPFDPAGVATCTAAPGAQCVIALRVRGNAQVTTYSYSTIINGTKNDPDLIIEG